MSRGGTEGFSSIVKRWLISGLGIWVGSSFVEGIQYEDTLTLVIVVLLLGLFNAVLKPLLVLLALPFVVLTFGIGILFINALLYLFVGNLVDGFYVDGFGSAFFGALFVSVLNLLFAGWIGGGGRTVSVRTGSSGGGAKRHGRPGGRVKAKDDVIDI
ncbi:phage holin family protein [Pelagicoccus sp. SDUM812003]|uniref:phage holin family protein n=1 Tax=Pelagicoccus sp. SDUM812003 TaxID=3041267 RepID=UPI00280FF422|nr:phage holin family protein [Pelagicoccus sp. SDUM812003]MDQ8203623.1 phage holin family protein [Pelagicoccus sp. SDUM812003]